MIGGTNTPKSKSNAIWGLRETINNSGGATDLFNGTYANWMLLGSQTSCDAGPGFRPEEAWNIDTKIDDGMPATGQVMGRFISTCTTTSNTALFTATYLLSSTSVSSCALIFNNAF